MITGTVIDAHHAGEHFVVAATKTTIWTTANFQNETPTWTQGYDILADTGFDHPSREILRVLCAPSIPGRIYALATERAGEADGWTWLIKSSDGGATWTKKLVGLEFGVYSPYSVETFHYFLDIPGAPGKTYGFGWSQVHQPMEGAVIFALAHSTTHGWCNGPHHILYPPPDGILDYSDNYGYLDDGMNRPGEPTESQFLNGAHQVQPHPNHEFSVFFNTYRPLSEEVLSPHVDDYLGAGNWRRDADTYIKPLEPGVTDLVGAGYGGGGYPHDVDSFSVRSSLTVFWYSPEPVFCGGRAFDVGKTNGNKVYVGGKEKIYRTVDGGETFEAYIETLGAVDIECHKAQTGDDNLTLFGTDGALYRTWGSNLGTPMLYGDKGDLTPLRIASDPDQSFPVFVLESKGGSLFDLRWSLAGAATGWATLAFDLPAAGSLNLIRALGGGLRVLYKTGSGVYASEDAGVTQTLKNGDLPGAGGVCRVLQLREGGL
jgi:hypothetical protein